MSLSTTQHSDSDSDDSVDKNASHPLLVQSSSSSPKSKSFATSTITIPALVKQNKSDATCNAKENRFLVKLGHFANIKLKRTEYRRSREKCSRINIGLLTVSFLTVIYFCVSMNLSVDKPSPQIIVDIPPVDVNLLGFKGNIFRKPSNQCLCQIDQFNIVH